jgi:hypothetical protein
LVSRGATLSHATPAGELGRSAGAEEAMSSTLFAYGDAAAGFLSDSTLTPDEVWPARPPAAATGGSQAGFRVAVSDADGRDFDRQVADALLMLRDRGPELSRLAAVPGVRLHLSFVAGKPDRDLAPGSDVAAWNCHLPAELVRLAAECGMSLSVKCDPLNLHTNRDG